MLDVLAGVCGADPWELSLPDRLDGLAALERVSGWLEAVKAQWLAAAAATPQDGEPCWGEDWAREDIAVHLNLSPAAADRRIQHARALDGRLITARDAMLAGRLAPIQAVALVEETTPVDDEVARLVAKQVLDRAGELTPGRFRNTVRRAVIAADPQGAGERRDRARADRMVAHWPAADGMATFQARLTGEDDTAVWQALTSLADSWTDARTLDQRRADALVALLTGQAAALGASGRPGHRGDQEQQGQPGPEPGSRPGPGPGPGPGRGRAAVQVLIDLPTLLGLADNPATLPGYGPLPPAVGRALAQDADWQRFVTDPLSGELLDLGRTRYRPSPRLREFIQARDRRCRFPGCTTPARRTDLDHTIPHHRDANAGPGGKDHQRGKTGESGKTNRANLVPLCRRHHRLKTHTRWRYERHDDGTVEWTDPRGKKWRDPPQRE